MNTKELGREFYFFRPYFSQGKPVQSTSFLGANHAIKYLYPSAHDPSTISGTVQNTFWKSMAYVVPVGGAPLDTATPQTVKDQIASLESSLPKEGNWPAILHAYETLLQEIPKPEKYADRDLYLKDKILFRQKLTEKIQKLKKGEILLLPATLQDRVNVFYLLNREEQGYGLKIIGCDEWMSELSGVPSKKIKDKDKVLSKIYHPNIPESFFSKENVTSLFCDPLLENFFSTENVKSLLAAFTPAAPGDAWVTKFTNRWKCLGLVIQELRGKGRDITSKIIMKRLEFQTQLTTLFKLYKQVRFDLEKDSKADTALRDLVKAIAKEAYLLGIKGYLTETDLAEIDKELDFIEQNCKKAAAQASLPLDKIGRLPAVAFPFAQPICMPDKLTELPAKPMPEQAQTQQGPVKLPFNKVLRSSLSSEEALALESSRAYGILQLLKSKSGQAQKLMQMGKSELVEAILLEVFQKLPIVYSETCWWINISTSQVLEVHRYCADMLKQFVDCRKGAFPLPTPTLAVHKVTLFISNLRLAYLARDNGIDLGENPLMQFEWIFGGIFDVKNHGSTAFLDRPFFIVDEHGAFIIEELKKSMNQYQRAKAIFTANENKQSKDISEEMGQSVVRFFNSAKFSGKNMLDTDFNTKIFPPNLQKQWSKPFRHPLFIALLTRMSITGKTADIVNKLYDAGKLRNVCITWSGEKPKVEGKGWNKTDEERCEMQKDFDRVESLKLPEAITDDPQRVVDSQIEAYLEWLKFAGIDKPAGFKKNLPHPYKKEELIDLLYLLRKKYPQLEVIPFLKTYPHLLIDSDIRNYLECILFDTKGSSFKDTADQNFEFMQQLPAHLHAEVNRYSSLAAKDPTYYHHLLFHLLLLRRLNCQQVLNQLYDVDRVHEKILHDPSLHPYHFRAAFEYLMVQLSKPTMASDVLVEVIRLYHRLQTLPRDDHDADPNEMADLGRHYAVFTQFIHECNAENFERLLNLLCSDQGLALDCTPWQGDFPRYSNDSYKIDLLKGQIISRRFKAALVFLPMAISQHPPFAQAFASVDRETMHVHALNQGVMTKYLVTDKEGLQGRIEEDKEGNRFYRKFQNQARELQVFVFKEEEFPLLHGLAGGVLYVDPDQPQTGFCLDANGKLEFKIEYTIQKGIATINAVFDYRSEILPNPCQVHLFNSLAFPGLKKLEFFEHPKGILLFSSEGQLDKIEFKRYGLSFAVKSNRLFCNDPKYSGYYIDLSASLADKKGVAYALLLRHADEEMPLKLLLPAASVIKTEEADTEAQASALYQFWTLASSYLWSATTTAEKAPDTLALYMPKYAKDLHLKYHVVTIRPCSEELLVVVDKNQIKAAMALVNQGMALHNFELALKTLKQLPLRLSDLSKEHTTLFLEFLQVSPKEDGHEAAVKIQWIFKLITLIEDKAPYLLIKEKLTDLLCRHAKIYLAQCKKMDQRLLLNHAQFSRMALAVKVTDLRYFQDHLSPLYLEKSVENHVVETKQEGWQGIDQVPSELLEQQIQAANSRPSAISLSTEGKAILYDLEELTPYFTSTPLRLSLPVFKLPEIDPNAPSCEKIALDKLKKEMEDYWTKAQKEKNYQLKISTDEFIKLLEERGKKLTRACTLKREAVDNLLRTAKHGLQGLALKGGMQALATFQEMSLAFMQKDLATLKIQGLLPQGIDVKELAFCLKDYYETETAKLILRNALSILMQMKESIIPGQHHVDLLYQVLSSKRYYAPENNPELLVYECFAQKVFRQLGAEKTQLHLFKNMLETPTGIFQARTGDGKTTVISVLWALLLADGVNLVVFKLLPALLEQSKGIFQEQLGIPFDKKICFIQFNLKISPVIREKRKEGLVEHSLFKQIYHQLLTTIVNKGCVLTDYKSFPLMQEKWIKLNREFTARRAEGLPIPAIEMEHWIYLRKVLILLKKREKCLMDEFDLPNRSCNRLQIPLGKPVELPEYFHAKSLELYEMLRHDNRLGLVQDQQRDLFKIHGKAVLLDLAKRIQAQLGVSQSLYYNEALLRYLTGEDEELLNLLIGKSDAEKDILAFYKDQICTFLPLALGKASGLGYKRSTDGLRTVPCPDDEPQENSRPGHPIEEINYTIQDHIQNGVSFADFKDWIFDLQAEAKKDGRIPQKQYQQFFPGASLPSEPLSDQELSDQLKVLNQTWEHVKYFLVLKLKQLEVSGEVISMNPHDSAAMPKETTGVSATLGCPDELPKQLKNTKDNAGILGEMIYRLVERTRTHLTSIEFTPENPYAVFKSRGSRYNALIDGGAFYRRMAPKEVAEKFLTTQHLAKVGFHDDKHKIDFVGRMDSSLSNKGFYFSKSKARGANVALCPDAVALLTVDSFKTLEDLVQNDGRMRLMGQMIQIVRSPFDPHITSTEALIFQCARNQGTTRSPGLYHSKYLEISHLVREKGFTEWLGIEDFEASLNKFVQWQSLFIQKPAHDYRVPGSYFDANKHQRKLNAKPYAALAAKKEEMLRRAKILGLQVKELEELDWSPEVIAQMPEWVAGPQDSISLGLEVEEELEMEHAVETEMHVEMEEKIEEELQFDQCGDVPFYPPWKSNKPEEYFVAEHFHPAFDTRICFLENFLPLARKDSLYKRHPFDKAMPRVRVIHVVMSEDKIAKVIFGDILDDAFHRPYGYSWLSEKEFEPLTRDYGQPAGSYDLRTRQWVSKPRKIPLTEDFQKIQAQVKFLNGEYDHYTDLEWQALKTWLASLANPEEMRHYFAKTILKTKPRQAEAFKLSKLSALFDEFNVLAKT